MHPRDQRGMALVSVLLLLALLMTLLVSYFALTRIELSTTRSTMESFRGFYAAEAGLNVRAELVRQAFNGFQQPTGESPDPDAADPPCSENNSGSGDFACVQYAFQERKVRTFLEEQEGSPTWIVVPRGEVFQNLSALESQYVVYAEARNDHGFKEALLEMHFRSRQVPLFQFGAFYDKDLELLSDAGLTLSGPVHTNGDLYVASPNALDIWGQVTSGGEIYRGTKHTDACLNGPVSVLDPDNLRALPTCSSGRRLYTQGEFGDWDGMVRLDVDQLTVPPRNLIEPTPGEVYWDRADVRIVLDVHGAPDVQVRNQDDSLNGAATTLLDACGAATHSDTMFNHRESSFIEMLDVDVRGLLDCIHISALLGVGKGLDDETDGGLVIYLGVDGPEGEGLNPYGVRVFNGAELASTDITAPAINGLTMVTDRSLYIQGDYNAADPLTKRPAGFLADSVNFLSNNWDDTASAGALNLRLATATSVYAALLAGTDTTGGVEGAGGQDSGGFNGGLEHLPRLHEDWSGVTLFYRGSFVSLGNPEHVDGTLSIGDPHFLPPVRDWDFDIDFEEVAFLPPLTPRLIYLRQELFVRQFEL